MKTKLGKLLIGGLFSVMVLTVGPAQACDCPPPPPPPCDGCPPDESVPFDSGLTLVLLGATAIGAIKVFGLNEAGSKV